MKEMSRRSFLKAGTAATAALALTPSDLLAKAKASKKTPTGKIKLLGVGVGGRGHADINGVTYKGKELAQNLETSKDKDTVLNMLNETTEGVNLLYKASTPPMSEIEDITIYLKILKSDGVLTLKALLALSNIFYLLSN